MQIQDSQTYTVSNQSFKSRRIKFDRSSNEVPKELIDAIKQSQELKKARKRYHIIVSSDKSDFYSKGNETHGVCLEIGRGPILTKIKGLMYKFGGNLFVNEPKIHKIILKNTKEIKDLRKDEIDSILRS